jgi:hypothetical protein
MANSAAKNISSLDSHTMVPTETRLGLSGAGAGAEPTAVAVATTAIMATVADPHTPTPESGADGVLRPRSAGSDSRPVDG